jgi:hypothetical protein
MQSDNAGVSELIAEILMVFLIIAIAIIVLVMILGVSLPAQKTAYIVTSASGLKVSGYSVVKIDHSQGDPVSLYPGSKDRYSLQFTMTNGSATYSAVPLPAAVTKGWRSGDSLYLVRNTSGVMLTDSFLSVPGNIGFSPGAWTISIVDKTSDVLVAQHTVILSGNTSSPPTGYTRYPGFTVEAWVKWNIPPNSGGDTTRSWATIVVDGDRDANIRYHLQHNSDNTKFEFAAATATSRQYGQSTTTPVAGTWYHVAGVYNKTDPANRLRLYVNGVNEKSIAIDGGGLKTSPNRYQVGGPAGIQWPGSTSMLRKFNGDIRGLATYEEAFSKAEILAHYQAGVP